MLFWTLAVTALALAVKGFQAAVSASAGEPHHA